MRLRILFPVFSRFSHFSFRRRSEDPAATSGARVPFPFHRPLHFPLPGLPAVLSAVLVSAVSCRFESHPASWHPPAGTAFKLRYSSETRLMPGGAWGAAPYVSSAEAEFSGTVETDSAKGEIRLALTADTLRFKADERAPDEEAYMDGRMGKYRASLSLSRTGQALSLDEEPALPPVAFSPLAIGRRLIYALPAFPEKPVRQGQRWDIVQPLLDKFHPGSRMAKHYALSAVRETPRGDLAVCLVEFEIWLDEDVGGADGSPALRGSGKVVFNLDRGMPESADLEMEGDFPMQPKGDGSAGSAGSSGEGPEISSVGLREKLALTFDY